MPNQGQPRTGKFAQTTVTWSNGLNFNGFLLVSLVPPILSAVTYTEGDYGLTYPAETLPAFATIPIQNGLLNSNLGLFYNEDISPPNTTYIARWYDTTKRLVSGPGSPFSVDSDPIVLTIPTPTAPTSGGTAPTPN